MQADTLVVEFSHRAGSQLPQEHFGYGFTIVASRKGGAAREPTPPLRQLQQSLVYLGAKYARWSKRPPALWARTARPRISTGASPARAASHCPRIAA